MLPTTSAEPSSRAAAVGRRGAAIRKVEKAALTLFLQHHPDDVTADDIAQAADISRRTFFRYFDSRDDILTATPSRSLLRTVEAVSARPPAEPLIEALIAVGKERTPSPEEEELSRLSAEIMVRYPDVWARALGRLRRTTDVWFATMIGDRLRALGEVDQHSGAVGAAVAAVVVHSYVEWMNEGQTTTLEDRLRTSFAALAATL